MANIAIVVGDTPEHVAATANGLGGNVQAADVIRFSTLTTEYAHFPNSGDIETATPGFVWVGPIA